LIGLTAEDLLAVIKYQWRLTIEGEKRDFISALLEDAAFGGRIYIGYQSIMIT